MRIALASLDQRWEDKPANLARCRELALAARAQGCPLVVFPELTLTGFSLEAGRLSESVDGSWTLAAFGTLAREAGLDVVFGACLTDARSGRPRNAFCLARTDGSALPVYEKLHLFSFAGEHEALEPGERLGRFTCAGLRVGATVCYDLRFPGLYALLGPDCDALMTIANWPARRVAHWRALHVARAIENQCYAIGVNRIGTDGKGLAYEKSTLVVAPDGEVLVPVVAGAELDIYDIDPARVAAYREGFPTLRDKRAALYRELGGDR